MVAHIDGPVRWFVVTESFGSLVTLVSTNVYISLGIDVPICATGRTLIFHNTYRPTSDERAGASGFRLRLFCHY